MGGWGGWGPFFKKVPFFIKKKNMPCLANFERCPKFLEYALFMSVIHFHNNHETLKI